TSQYAAAAQAVEDGFRGAAAAFPDPGAPQILVYDIGSDPAAAAQYYRQAEQAGAQLIVGPLGIAAVNALVQAVTLRVPTLLLSHTAQPIRATGADVFQFGLPPGQEARQVAQRAYIKGRRHAAVLFPATPSGQRVAAAFTAYWQQLGGTVPASQAYTPGLGDYGAPVDRLLNINQSLERHNQLQNLLHVPLKFESRRRQDIDMVFLVADAQDGRLIKPQLNFHHAGNLPVYSTSYIFTGIPDPVDDRDLDGITFGDMPWLLVGSGRMAVLRARLTNDQKYVNTPLDRLYALGVDAYRLLPRLLTLSTNPAARFHGATSTLTIGPGGIVHRQLVWARFRKGLPHLADRFLGRQGRFRSANQE
ncbi:MAG TPA: penicillin-binding protein activator, partial [Acidiferrobacteraceae bacterium]|nr:penicillin-binding protein activator [Acidiferrobacteraceae bacterium]